MGEIGLGVKLSVTFSNKDTVFFNQRIGRDAVWEDNEGRHWAKRRRRNGRRVGRKE